MIVTLENSSFTARVNTFGAELCSLRRKQDGAELIWQGDARYWSGHAPTLFPITGKLRDLRFTHKGRSYEMPPHGFAKDSPFTVEQQSDRALTLCLTSSEQTLRRYPFPFRFLCTFALTDQGLRLTRRVENTGSEEMFFSVGEHLGLALPPDTPLDQCQLTFSTPQTACNWRLDGGLLKERQAFLDNASSLALSKKLFREYGCLVLQGLNAPWITLRCSGRDWARVSAQGFPTVVVWSPDNAGAFVCVEPWQGLPSDSAAGYELARRPCILRLAPGRAYAYTLYLEAL